MNCRLSAKERRPLHGETDALRNPPPAILRVCGRHRRRSTQQLWREREYVAVAKQLRHSRSAESLSRHDAGASHAHAQGAGH